MNTKLEEEALAAWLTLRKALLDNHPSKGYLTLLINTKNALFDELREKKPNSPVFSRAEGRVS